MEKFFISNLKQCENKLKKINSLKNQIKQIYIKTKICSSFYICHRLKGFGYFFLFSYLLYFHSLNAKTKKLE